MMTSKGRLFLGARKLAGHVLGDEDKHRLIYGLATELPVFMFGGRIAGYERELDAAMATKQAGVKETAAQKRRKAKQATCEGKSA